MDPTIRDRLVISLAAWRRHRPDLGALIGRIAVRLRRDVPGKRAMRH